MPNLCRLVVALVENSGDLHRRKGKLCHHLMHLRSGRDHLSGVHICQKFMQFHTILSPFQRAVLIMVRCGSVANTASRFLKIFFVPLSHIDDGYKDVPCTHA